MTNIKWEKVEGGLKTDRNWPAKGQELKVGDSIEGRYVEKSENVGPNSANVYILESGIELIGVWGGTVIDSRMDKVAVGKMVKIQYKGLEKGKSGKQYKNYEIYVGIDVAGDEGKAKGSFKKDEDLPEIQADELDF